MGNRREEVARGFARALKAMQFQHQFEEIVVVGTSDFYNALQNELSNSNPNLGSGKGGGKDSSPTESGKGVAKGEVQVVAEVQGVVEVQGMAKGESNNMQNFIDARIKHRPYLTNLGSAGACA